MKTENEITSVDGSLSDDTPISSIQIRIFMVKYDTILHSLTATKEYSRKEPMLLIVTILWIINKKFVCFKSESSLTARIIRLNITKDGASYVECLRPLSPKLLSLLDKNSQHCWIQMTDASESLV
jgi:hypothetical protein